MSSVADANTLACLQSAINDSQGTIRAYDQKANAMGVLLTVALGITNFTVLQSSFSYSRPLLTLCWLLGLLAIGALGMVLHPHQNPWEKISMGEYSPKGTYFLHSVLSPEVSVSKLASEALSTNWVAELTYESMKLSLIRDYKHRLFNFAMKCSGFLLVIVAITTLFAAWGR